MPPLTDEERRGFLSIYGGMEDSVAIPDDVLRSLLDRGLIEYAGAEIQPTDAGDELYGRISPPQRDSH